MVVAIAVIAVAIVWWLRRPDETSNDPDQASGTANTGGSSNRKRASGLAFAQPDATGRTIAGVVVMDGAPVSGATVRLISQRTMSGLPEPRVISDAAGRFDFGPQLATRYLVVGRCLQGDPRHAVVAELDRGVGDGRPIVRAYHAAHDLALARFADGIGGSVDTGVAMVSASALLGQPEPAKPEVKPDAAAALPAKTEVKPAKVEPFRQAPKAAHGKKRV